MFAAYVPADNSRGTTTPRTVRSSSGLSIVPEFDLAHDPEAFHFDRLILGAGAIEYSSNSNSNSNSNNCDTTAAAAAMEYVQKQHDRGGRILTVCTGAYYVAALGLLDGSGDNTTNTTTTLTTINATTHSLFLEEFRTDFPKVH